MPQSTLDQLQLPVQENNLAANMQGSKYAREGCSKGQTPSPCPSWGMAPFVSLYLCVRLAQFSCVHRFIPCQFQNTCLMRGASGSKCSTKVQTMRETFTPRRLKKVKYLACVSHGCPRNFSSLPHNSAVLLAEEQFGKNGGTGALACPTYFVSRKNARRSSFDDSKTARKKGRPGERTDEPTAGCILAD